MLEPPKKIETAKDVVEWVNTILTEIEEMVEASLKVQELYIDLLELQKETQEELKHYKRMVWGEDYEQY